jgi:hypothetical protein
MWSIETTDTFDMWFEEFGYVLVIKAETTNDFMMR